MTESQTLIIPDFTPRDPNQKPEKLKCSNCDARKNGKQNFCSLMMIDCFCGGSDEN